MESAMQQRSSLIRKILVVDDNAINHRLLIHMLPSFETTSVHSGMAAVQTVLKSPKPFDLIFMDFHMPPGLDGIETAKRIKAIQPKAKIVLWTTEAKKFNPDIFVEQLAKAPIVPEELERIVKNYTASPPSSHLADHKQLPDEAKSNQPILSYYRRLSPKHSRIIRTPSAPPVKLLFTHATDPLPSRSLSPPSTTASDISITTP